MDEEKETVRVIKAGSVPWKQAGEKGLGIQGLISEGTINKVFISRADPGWSDSWIYDYVEVLHVLRGEFTVYWDDKKVVAKAGDTICIEPRGRPYLIRWENSGKKPAEVFGVLEPHGVDKGRTGMTPKSLRELLENL